MGNYYHTGGAAQGWQCPICYRVLSPWTIECPCKGKPEWEKSVTDNETYKITMDRIPANMKLEDYTTNLNILKERGSKDERSK